MMEELAVAYATTCEPTRLKCPVTLQELDAGEPVSHKTPTNPVPPALSPLLVLPSLPTAEHVWTILCFLGFPYAYIPHPTCTPYGEFSNQLSPPLLLSVSQFQHPPLVVPLLDSCQIVAW
eukprot:EG_transcript_24232